VRELEKELGRPVKAFNHKHIKSLLEFVETFLHYFTHGANSERVTENEEMFFEFLKLVKNIPHREEFGGNSAVFTLRAQMEGCTVYSAAQDKGRIGKWIKKKDASGKLIWPKSQINEVDKEKNKD